MVRVRPLVIAVYGEIIIIGECWTKTSEDGAYLGQLDKVLYKKYVIAHNKCHKMVDNELNAPGKTNPSHKSYTNLLSAFSFLQGLRYNIHTSIPTQRQPLTLTGFPRLTSNKVSFSIEKLRYKFADHQFNFRPRTYWRHKLNSLAH